MAKKPNVVAGVFSPPFKNVQESTSAGERETATVKTTGSGGHIIRSKPAKSRETARSRQIRK